jgi:hypothetical protein
VTQCLFAIFNSAKFLFLLVLAKKGIHHSRFRFRPTIPVYNVHER